MRIDGGMAANEWLCQFLADMLRVPVERPKNLETTALGAAFLAGLATGVWSGLDEIAQHLGNRRMSLSRPCPRGRDSEYSKAGATP